MRGFERGGRNKIEGGTRCRFLLHVSRKPLVIHCRFSRQRGDLK
jgi:hypothetical protein